MHRPLARWFLPGTPDLIGVLVRHTEVMAGGMERFAAWAHGDVEAAQAVRLAEKRADDARRELLDGVRDAYWTAIEPEDLFELAERVDAVIGEAKDLVREAEVMGMVPDEHLAAMADAASLGARALVGAVAALRHGGDEAFAAARAAIHEQRAIERCYRRAMARAGVGSDLRTVVDRRELYRRGARIADDIGRVAHRVEYALVKRS